MTRTLSPCRLTARLSATCRGQRRRSICRACSIRCPCTAATSALRGVIVGGGYYDDGPGRLGVWLEHDPADFGMR